MRWLGLVVISLLPACKCAQASRCASGNGDRAACEAMSDDCFTLGGARCSDPSGRCVVAEGGGCAVDPRLINGCEADDRIWHGSSAGDLPSYDWKAKWLSAAALKLANRAPSQVEFDALSDGDKHELCASIDGDPCVLEWSGREARCRVPTGVCERFTVVNTPVTCIPKNKCNGVICL